MTDRVVVVRPEPERVVVRGGLPGPKGDPGSAADLTTYVSHDGTPAIGDWLKVKSVNPLVVEKAAAPSGGGAVELIASTTLAADAASIDFASIPQTYRHLRLIVKCRTTEATTLALLAARFNNDLAANYDSIRIFSSGAVASAGQFTGETYLRLGVVPGTSAPAAHAGSVTVDIPDYSTTTLRKQLIAHSFATVADAAGNYFQQFTGSGWRSTAAINRVTLLPGAANLASGSTASLYGIKGA